MGEKSLGERAFILMIGRIAAVVLGLATPMVLVRVFSQTEFGAYRQINLALFTVLGLLSLGFPASLYYFFPKYPHRRRTFVSQAFFSQVVFGCVFIGFTLFSGEILAKFFKHDIFRIASPLIGLTALFQLVRQFMESLLIVEKRVAWASLYVVGHDTLRSLSLVIVILIVPTLMAILYTLVIYEALAFLIVLVYISIRYNMFQFPFSKDAISEQSRYAFPFGFGRAVSALTQRLDQYLIVAYYSPADFALYSQGAFPMRFFNILPQSIYDIAIPDTVTKISKGNISEQLRFFHNVVNRIGVICLPLVVLSQIIGVDAMVLLFTEQYRHSGYLFQIYIFTLLAFITGFAIFPRAYARTGLILRSTIVSFIVMAVFGFVGTLYFGMYGTIAAMIISQYVRSYMQLECGRKDVGVSWKQYLPWRQLGRLSGVAILSAVLPTIAALLIPSIVGRLLTCIPLYLGSYLTLLCLTGVYDWIHDPSVRNVLKQYLSFLKI